VTATHLHVDAIFLQYQALAAATANNPVATQAPALTWERDDDLIHNILSEWAKKLIVTSPDLFDSKPALWADCRHHCSCCKFLLLARLAFRCCAFCAHLPNLCCCQAL